MTVFILPNNPRYSDIERITSIVCSNLSIIREDLHIRNRKSELVFANHLSMYLCKKYTTWGHAIIAKIVSTRDHATCIHAIKSIQNYIDTDKHTAAIIAEIEKKIIDDFNCMPVELCIEDSLNEFKKQRKIVDWYIVDNDLTVKFFDVSKINLQITKK